ncbi:MAG TPA: hypothetical protein VGY58_15105, partial [Gemmataceae bacterium]|nr:hypothetical protein [Gemmataceae bacterium]
MFTLTRKEFPNVTWTREDLDALTDLWLAWHEQARGKWMRPVRGYHAISVQLWGFPRHEREPLRQQFQQNLSSAEAIKPVFDDTDPDYLSAGTRFLDFLQPCSLGTWYAAIDCPAFHGLVAILRLSVQDWPAAPEGEPFAGGALAVCGRIGPDGLLVKALWPSGLDGGIEELYLHTGWSEEAKILDSVEYFREAGVIPLSPAQLFVTRSTQRWQVRIASLIVHLPEQGRLSS